jgi:hypothetical protein
MNIQALHIKVGRAGRTERCDRIFAYCEQKMVFLDRARVSRLDAQQHHTENIHICALSGISLLHGSVSPRGSG